MAQNSAISIFDMLKIGVGPSSSHTLGPWRAVQSWLESWPDAATIDDLRIHLYGSLALTGKGHATDAAICLALLGQDPEHIELDSIDGQLADLASTKSLQIQNKTFRFDSASDIHFHPDESLPEHPNGMACEYLKNGAWQRQEYFSVGGGFVVQADQQEDSAAIELLYPCQTAAELLRHCEQHQWTIAELVRHNEPSWRTEKEIAEQLTSIWQVMRDGIFRGCNTQGKLPGGLDVSRRAHSLSQQLLPGQYKDAESWIASIRQQSFDFNQTMRWLSCFALAVNEENAAMGRVVTAPTNGAAGVIPAVLMHHICFGQDPVDVTSIENFLMVAGEIGTYFKKGATISAAAGGCQAEIGVSSAMAAAALCESLGGSVRQSLMAAEIAMEHHLGMTCDPVGGLVQIPCIERNAMGAVKAVNAAQLALASDPNQAKVSLDAVIQTLAETARDMNHKYKETSLGGLAVNISVAYPEC